MCLGDVNVGASRRWRRRSTPRAARATHVELDVTSEEDAAAAVAHTVEQFGSINVLLNNAGINKPLFFLDITRRELAAHHGRQRVGHPELHAGRSPTDGSPGHAGPPLQDHQRRLDPVPGVFDDVVVYGASKHAVLALIKGGAKALIEHNITVNGYGPGVVRTELWEQLDKDLVAIGKFDKPGESMDSLAENMILMKRYSYPEDVVGTASFLASSESDYMTGQLLMIDGGMVIQ